MELGLKAINKWDYDDDHQITNYQNEKLYMLRFLYKIGRFLANYMEKVLEIRSDFMQN